MKSCFILQTSEFTEDMSEKNSVITQMVAKRRDFVNTKD